MSDTQTEPTVRERSEAQRLTLLRDWDALIKQRDTERETFQTRRDSEDFKALTQEQRDAEIKTFADAEAVFKAASEQHDAQLRDFDKNVADREMVEKRLAEAAAAAAGTTGASIKDEPLTYRRDNARERSYWADLAMTLCNGLNLQTNDKDQALQRLTQHSKEMATLLPKRAAARAKLAEAQFIDAELEGLEARAKTAFDRRGLHDRSIEGLIKEIERHGLSYSPFERRVEPNLTQGQGGYFSPPTWLVDDFIPGLRAHRVIAGLPRQMDLPSGTDSINIPKLSTLTVVGYQQVNNSGLPSQDWTDTSVQANVKTIGGYVDIALQLLELSPHQIVDEVITQDLMAAFNKFEDGEVAQGDGLNANTLNGGHLKGLYPYTNWSGTNNVTYTDASPSGQHFISVLGCMASNVAENRFDIQNYATVLTGRRAFWYSCALDANGRPLGESQSGGPWNVAANLQGTLQPEGLFMRLPFLGDTPVYIDDNLTTSDTTGGGSGQDVAISGNWNDAWLFNSPLRTDVFREVLSGSMGVRFRVYSYRAFLVRYGQSFSVATGSGFAAPQGAVSSLTF